MSGGLLFVTHRCLEPSAGFEPAWACAAALQVRCNRPGYATMAKLFPSLYLCRLECLPFPRFNPLYVEVRTATNRPAANAISIIKFWSRVSDSNRRGISQLVYNTSPINHSGNPAYAALRNKTLLPTCLFIDPNVGVKLWQLGQINSKFSSTLSKQFPLM